VHWKRGGLLHLCSGRAAWPGFACGRDFAAWLGLAPRQHSSGGKQKIGAITRPGERSLRRLLIIGASAVVPQASNRDTLPKLNFWPVLAV
jgi:transposase